MTETIVVTGDRQWHNWKRIKVVLQGLKEGGAERLVHGDCPTGADHLADVIGRDLGFEVIPVPADWSVGRKAGPIRNRAMLDEFKPRLVVAFHDDLEQSKGTKDCVGAALQRKIPVLLWSQKEVTVLDSL